MGQPMVYRRRLGELVKKRRIELSLSVRAAAKVAGIDRATWTGLEEGTKVTQDRHYAGIERALRWPTGYIASVASGVHPDARDPGAPELRDDNERKIWSMDLVDEDLRLDYIRMYRERRQASGEQETA